MMDGWKEDLEFYILLIVFQSYQDDGWVIMNGCVQWMPVYDRKDPCLRWARTGTTRSAGLCLTH